ncbi:hypothetical protein [Bradyrhizobium genosp. P]|uniref:hypothetical protein n=1 Tax=Bradyrhizobium genosp. P TaxID=83641 RepID=UPI003CEC24CA
MITRHLLPCFLLLAATSTALAGTPQTVLGLGTHSCGTWTANHSKDNEEAYAEDQWVLGFLSARNGPDNSDFLKTMDAPGILAAMSKYCGSYPLEAIFEAAAGLSVELKRRMKSN